MRILIFCLLYLSLSSCYTISSKKTENLSQTHNENLNIVKYLGTKAIYSRPPQNEFMTDNFRQGTQSCKPFFLFYLGRHGARGETSEQKLKDQIEDIKPFLQQFPEGIKYQGWLTRYYEELKPYTDALTPPGKSQVEEIGAALFNYWPGFSDRITLAYTTKNRVIETRNAFLHPWQKNQSLFIKDETQENPDKVTEALRFFKFCSKYVTNHKKLKKLAKNFCAPHLDDKIFRNWAGNKGLDTKNMDIEDIADGFKSIKNLCAYQVAVSSLTSQQQFCSLLSKEALEKWNAYENCTAQIVKGGPAGLKFMNGISVCMADALVNSITDKIKDTLSKHLNKDPSTPTALLMFAHAETIIPTLTQLNLSSEDTWNAADISPMAANFKMIFFDCESSKDSEKIQVYLSLNERAVRIVDSDPNKATYNWEQISSYLTEISSSTNFETVCYNDDTNFSNSSEIEDD